MALDLSTSAVRTAVSLSSVDSQGRAYNATLQMELRDELRRELERRTGRHDELHELKVVHEEGDHEMELGI